MRKPNVSARVQRIGEVLAHALDPVLLGQEVVQAAVPIALADLIAPIARTDDDRGRRMRRSGFHGGDDGGGRAL